MPYNTALPRKLYNEIKELVTDLYKITNVVAIFAGHMHESFGVGDSIPVVHLNREDPRFQYELQDRIIPVFKSGVIMYDNFFVLEFRNRITKGYHFGHLKVDKASSKDCKTYKKYNSSDLTSFPHVIKFRNLSYNKSNLNYNF